MLCSRKTFAFIQTSLRSFVWSQIFTFGSFFLFRKIKKMVVRYIELAKARSYTLLWMENPLRVFSFFLEELILGIWNLHFKGIKGTLRVETCTVRVWSLFETSTTPLKPVRHDTIPFPKLRSGQSPVLPPVVLNDNPEPSPRYNRRKSRYGAKKGI